MINLKTEVVALLSDEKIRVYTVPELHVMAGGFPFTAVKAQNPSSDISVDLEWAIHSVVTITELDKEDYVSYHLPTREEVTVISAYERIWSIHRPHDWGAMMKGEFK